MRYIVIEGNIGVGKTTLAKRHAKEQEAIFIREQFADNPFLPKFYRDPERYAFPLEMSFLAGRHDQMKQEITRSGQKHSLLIADYYFAKSVVFAENTLNRDEFG